MGWKIGAAILSGGKSSRMGVCKADLALGGKSMLEHVKAKLERFDEIILSVGNSEQYDDYGMTVVRDVYQNCGPIGGIHASLKACSSDALLFVPCDMPAMDTAVIDFLLSFNIAAFDAIVPIRNNGRLHPLCAIYRKSTADVFEKQITDRHYRILDAYDFMNVCTPRLSEAGIPDDTLLNVNTPEEYDRILEAMADK